MKQASPPSWAGRRAFSFHAAIVTRASLNFRRLLNLRTAVGDPLRRVWANVSGEEGHHGGSRRRSVLVFPTLRSSRRATASAIAGVLDDAAQELHDELSGDERGVLGRDVQHRIDLDEVEAHHLGVARDGNERLAQLLVAQTVHLGRGAAWHQW